MDQPPSETRPSSSRGFDPLTLVQVLGGLALIGIGAYWVIAKGSRVNGPALISAGLILMPFPPLAIIGGLGFIGLGVYQFVHYKSITTYGLIFVILGVVALAERGGRIFRKS